MRRSSLALVVAASSFLACSSDPSDSGPGGAAGADAGTLPDATPDVTPDTMVDAGADTATDTTIDVTPDVMTPDSATPDAGADAADEQSPDDGSADAVADTSTDSSPSDAGPSGPNVIANPGFEFWTDGLPDSWKGATSNITDDAVTDQTASPHGGAHACGLANSSTTHKRFSTATFPLADGYYDCTYWVRGKGEVRNVIHDGNDYGTYSSYTTVDSPDWQQLSWGFNLHGDADAFELVFSLRSTEASLGDLQFDDVYCARRAEACDQVTCPDWAACDPGTLACEPLYGRCADAQDCLSWQQCDGTHTCVVAPGRCESTADCDVASATPVCDKPSHTCVAGDPCAGVTCEAWKQCDPATALCVLKPGRCNSTADCLGILPACDGATRTCVSADHPSNIVPNGGFESWSVYDIPYEGEHLIPDGWYGLDIPGSSEIDPARVLQYTTAPHAGALALQLIQDGIAERFTSELFNVPYGNHTCVYWVRGKGSIRHRTYSSGGWSPYTDLVEVDTLVWTPVPFMINNNVHDMRVIFYASYTDPAKDHVQIDDVVCTRDPS
jgi:hypothetical protein